MGRSLQPDESEGCSPVSVVGLVTTLLQFKIDRSAGSCRTPRRNEDVDAVLPAPWRYLCPSPRAEFVPCRWRLRARFA